MAESLNSTRRFVFKEPKILVNVDHASDDLLVVSYPYRSKLFQGILIDSTNRYLPCAYPSPEVVKWSPPRVIDIKDPTAPTGETAPEPDRAFYSLSNRFTYFQDLLFQKNVALIKSAKQAKAKAQKMTVRLRPRQVLCSKCRSICNENSENVRSPSSAKKEEKQEKHLGGADENQNDENTSPRKKVRTTLVPKLSRLEPDDIRDFNGRQGEASRVWSEMLEADKQMVLRKKRSVGSMEDLWDETVFEEAAKKAKTTPIIKISFGSPGEGTVLKIPAKVKLSGSEAEDEEDKGTTESSKSLKKAMKKAKKEAKRKMSPEREEDPSPEEPNYKKHRHRVKHKKRHKNSKDEDPKEKSVKQKLSISLRRVCGPGEEESWSGESSRSSEPHKDSEDNKLEPIQDSSVPELTSRVISEDTVDSKEPAKRTALEPVETPKRSKRVSSQNKKKMESTEPVKPGKPPDQVLERLSDISKTGDTPPVSSARSKQETVRTVKFAQNPTQSKKGPDSNPKSDSYLLENDSLLKVKNNESKHLDQKDSEAECLPPTKEITQVEGVCATAGNEDRMSPVMTKEDEIQFDISEPKSDDKTNIELTFKMDDTLEDNLISEDSMPELDETIEDALLESDKEMPEVLENQRISCLNEGWDTEREIPVLTRMVDPEEVKPKKITLRLATGQSATDSKSSFIPQDNTKLKISSKLKSEKIESKFSDCNVKRDQSKIKFEKLLSDDLCEKPEDYLSSNRSLSHEVPLPSDDAVDSSEELEFLPAEDYFDETLDVEIPPCPKDSTLLKDRRSTCEAVKDDIPTKCVHSPDPRTYEDCLSPKASLDFELGQYASNLVEPSMQNSFIEVKRSKSCQDPSDALVSPLVDKSKPLPHNLEKGCEKEKIPNPTQIYKHRDSPSPEPTVFASSSVNKRRASSDEVPDMDSHYSSKLPLGKTLSLEDDTLPQGSESNLTEGDPCKKSLWKSGTLLVDNLSEISEDESLSITVRDNSEKEVTSEKACLKSKGQTFHPEECSDSMDTSSPDGCLDSVPNFPESSPRNTPQEVTSCQTMDGSVLSVGDIVWAKIHGFPWWPAKVTRLSGGGSGSSGCDARVAWFGSATSSLMSTDQLSPFIQTFKAKYNRERKSTGYLEAIRQATSEAASSCDFHQPTPLAEIDKLLAL